MNSEIDEDFKELDQGKVTHILDQLSVMCNGNTDEMLSLLGGSLCALASYTLDDTVNMDITVLEVRQGRVHLSLKYIVPKVVSIDGKRIH